MAEEPLRTGSILEMTEILKPRFGDRTINEAASRAFQTREVAASAVVSAAPRINITGPSKPWGT